MTGMALVRQFYKTFVGPMRLRPWGRLSNANNHAGVRCSLPRRRPCAAGRGVACCFRQPPRASSERLPACSMLGCTSCADGQTPAKVLMVDG